MYFLGKPPLIALCGAVLLARVPIALAAEGPSSPTLGNFSLEQGGTSAASTDGGFVTFDPRADRVVVWDEEGHATTSFPLPERRKAVSARVLAARPGVVLVGWSESEDSPENATVISVRSRAVLGEFEFPAWPARVFAGTRGWIVETTDSDGSTLLEIDDHGRTLRSLGAPKDLADRAESTVGRRDAATLKVAAAKDGFWAVPAGMYEIWHLEGTARGFDVPRCMWAAGNQVEGDVARQKTLQTLDGADPTVRNYIEPRILASMGSGRPYHGFFSAVVAVAAYGDRLGVLIDALPQLSDGGCRLDVWRVPDGVLMASMPVPGPRPSNLTLGRRGAWVRQLDHFAFLPLLPAPLALPGKCRHLGRETFQLSPRVTSIPAHGSRNRARVKR